MLYALDTNQFISLPFTVNDLHIIIYARNDGNGDRTSLFVLPSTGNWPTSDFHKIKKNLTEKANDTSRLSN